MCKIFEKICIPVKICEDFFTPEVLHKILWCIGINVLDVSTQKSKVRFYPGQILSPHKSYAPFIPQPRSHSTSPHPSAKQGQNYPWAKSHLLPPSSNPTAALPSYTSALPLL
jgi:hypothetical protein